MLEGRHGAGIRVEVRVCSSPAPARARREQLSLMGEFAEKLTGSARRPAELFEGQPTVGLPSGSQVVAPYGGATQGEGLLAQQTFRSCPRLPRLERVRPVLIRTAGGGDGRSLDRYLSPHPPGTTDCTARAADRAPHLSASRRRCESEAREPRERHTAEAGNARWCQLGWLCCGTGNGLVATAL